MQYYEIKRRAQRWANEKVKQLDDDPLPWALIVLHGARNFGFGERGVKQLFQPYLDMGLVEIEDGLLRKVPKAEKGK